MLADQLLNQTQLSACTCRCKSIRHRLRPSADAACDPCRSCMDV